MKLYANHHGDSGIVEYEFTVDSIKVTFKHGKKPYTYSNAITGKSHVDIMKELAISGRGLSTYIAQHKEMKFI